MVWSKSLGNSNPNKCLKGFKQGFIKYSRKLLALKPDPALNISGLRLSVLIIPLTVPFIAKA